MPSLGPGCLTELIKEGAGFKDEFKSNAGLSKSAYSILPCVYSTSTTSTQTSNSSNPVPSSEPLTSQETPAIKTVSNGSSIYSVMYAGTGNKITIKRKAATSDDVVDTMLQSANVNVQQPQVQQVQGSVGVVKCIPASQLYSQCESKKTSKSGKVRLQLQ